MRNVLLASIAVCCLCGFSSGSPSPAHQPFDPRSFSGWPLNDTEAAWFMEALRVAHDDLRFAHDDLLRAHFDLMAVRDDLLAFADQDGQRGPPKGKGKKDEAPHHGKEKGKPADGEKGKPPHAGPPHKPDEKGPPHKKPEGGPPHKQPGHDEAARPVPHHEQMLAEIRAIREMIEPGQKPHDKKEADKPDGPPHEQVLRELRELRKAVEKHHVGKKQP